MAFEEYRLLRSIVPPQRPERVGRLMAGVTAIDLSGYLSPVKDQGAEGSCTAFGHTSAREWWIARQSGQAVRLSEQFLYYLERLAEGDVTVDAGADPSDGCRALVATGCAPYQDEPYVAGQIDTPPSPKEYDDAASYKAQSWREVADVQSALALLDDGKPIVIAIAVLPAFMSPQAGVVAANGDWQILGYHLMVCYGYNQTGLRVRNSWGPGYGDQGDVTIAYDYFQPPQGNVPTFIGAWQIDCGTLPVPAPPSPYAPAPQPTPVPPTPPTPPAPPAPPDVLPIYVSGQEQAFVARRNGNEYDAPAVLLARAMGAAASRDEKGVYITPTPKE